MREANGAVPAPTTTANAPALSSRGSRMTNRSFARNKGVGEWIESFKKADKHPTLVTSFDALNFRQQRVANRGNQFSVEPPDQGLCVGNGFVMETVNDVLRIFDTGGNALTDPIDLNTFYSYAPAIVRPSTFGPSITDPSCYFDKDTQRWFHIVVTLDRVGTTSSLSGNHLDIAVSDGQSAGCLEHLELSFGQDDGTDGTPDHNCSGGADKNGQPTGHGPCFGDYPHIGADANGIYVTTNEFSFFGPEFKSAQIYAISKKALAQGALSITRGSTPSIICSTAIRDSRCGPRRRPPANSTGRIVALNIS
jgi:hypothetical protein